MGRMFPPRQPEQRARWLKANGVPIAPFREAFDQSGMTISEFARRMGYMHTVPNIDRARRALGIRPDTDSRVGRRKDSRQWCSVKQAQLMAAALELDPVDLDF